MTEPTAPDLEPCPFCGGDCAYVDGEYEWKDDNRYIELTLETSCDIDLTLRATVNYMQAKGMTKEEKQRVLVDQLSEQWNTRPAPAVTDQARIAAMTITNSTIQAHQIVSDVRSEKTDPLQPYVPHNVVLSALSAIQPESPNTRAYELAYAIAGGEDAPGLLDSIPTADLVKMIRDERAQQQGWMDATAKVARDEALREAAVKARCAFDERGNGRSGHHSEMDWSDGYRDGTLAAEKVILALIDQPAPAPTPQEGGGVSAIASERKRQMEIEGWTAERDDRYRRGELALAAESYLFGTRTAPNREPPSMWPSTWIKKWWKPKSYRQDLVRSGALIAAEIDRWDRALIDQPAPAPQTVQEAAKVLLDAGKLPEEAVLVAHNQIDWHRGEQNTFSPTHRTQTHMGGTSCAKDIQDAWKEALRAISDTPAPLSPKG